MSASKPRGLYAELVQAALDYRALEPWTRFTSEDVIALEIPTEPAPVAASIMGSIGTEHGLCLYRGERAFELFLDLLESSADSADDDLIEALSQMSVTFEPRRDIPRELRGPLKRAGFSTAPDRIAPFFMAKDPGRRPREPRAREAETFIYALRALEIALESDLIQPRRWRRGRPVPVLRITGSPFDPEVEAGPGLSVSTTGSAPDRSAVASPESLSELEELDGRWLIGYPVLPGCIEGDDRTLRGVLIVDEDSGLILQLRASMAGEMVEAAEVVYAAMAGENSQGIVGRPREILVSSRSIFDAIAPELELHGIRCQFQDRVPALDAVVEDVQESMLDGPSGISPEEDPDPDPGVLPASDDADGWRQADHRAIASLLALVRDKGLDTDRARARYFGEVEIAEALLTGGEDPGIVPCYYEWLFAHYRATVRSRTVVERALAMDPSPAYRALLEERRSAVPSIYRVERLIPGRGLVLADIIRGGTVEVRDVGLSESAVVDAVLPAHVTRAGDYRFVTLLGPGVPPMRSEEALDFLRDQRLDLDSGEPVTAPHLFGRLWAWQAFAQARGRPRLTNTDGDDLCFHDASFSCESPREVERVLGRRPDVEPSDDGDGYEWLRDDSEREGAIGDVTLLGRIQLIGDELVLEVNSAERLERARRWLEEIPGVAFESATTRPVGSIDDLPLDDRTLDPGESDPPPPEAIEQLREMLRRQMMRWLDESVPALGGQTPREACRTAEGRRRVAMMIRSMPRPGGMEEFPGGGVDVPRREMFRELGLEWESGDGPPPEDP